MPQFLFSQTLLPLFSYGFNLGAFTGARLGVGNRSCVLVAAGPLICPRPIWPSRFHGHSSTCTQLRCGIRVFLGFRKSKYGNQFACMPSNHFGCERAGSYICICLPETRLQHLVTGENRRRTAQRNRRTFFPHN